MPAPAASLPRTRLGLFGPTVVVSVVLFLFILGAVIWNNLKEREHLLELTRIRTQHQVQVLAEQINKTLQSVDLSLSFIVTMLRQGFQQGGTAPDEILKAMDYQAMALEATADILILDRDGLVVANHDSFGRLAADFSTHEILARHRDEWLDFNYGLVKAGSGKYYFSLSRRIPAPKEPFTGLVLALVDPQYFQEHFRQTWTLPADSLAIFTDQGLVLAAFDLHSRLDLELAGRQIGRLPLFSTSGDKPAALSGAASYISDKAVVSSHQMRDFPFRVAVAQDLEKILTEWTQRAVRGSILVMLLTVGLILAAMTVARLMDRRAEASADLRRSESRARAMGLLRNLALAANEAADLKSALLVCLKEMCAFADCPAGLAGVFQSPGPEVLWQPAPLEGLGTGLVEALARRLGASDQPVWLDLKDPQTSTDLGVSPNLGFDRILVLPVWTGQRLTALLALFKTGYGSPDLSPTLSSGLVNLIGRISEAKLAEAELKKSEAILRQSQSLAKIAGWEIDLLTGQVYWTEEAYRICEVQPGHQPTLETGLDYFPGQARRIMERAVEAARTEGKPWDLELPFVTAAGRRLWVRSAGQAAFQDGRVVKLSGTFQDVTERKLSEEAKERLQKRLAALWNVASLVDADLRTLSDHALRELQDMTQSRYALFGPFDEAKKIMTPLAWSGEILADCRVENAPAHFPLGAAGLWAEAIRQGRPIIVNDYGQDLPGKKGLPPGHVTITRLLAVPVLRDERIVALGMVADKPEDYTEEDARQVAAFIGSVQIILERKRAEEEKARLEDQLRHSQKMEAIGTLAGGIAHDFNNILMAIMGYTELAAEEVGPDSATGAKLDQVLIAARRARGLVQQILSFSRKTQTVRRPVDLVQVIDEALRLIRATLPATVEIETRLETKEALILGDPTQMHQLLMNLCANAAQSMEGSGGRLTVGLTSLDLDQTRTARLADLPAGAYHCLRVTDTGRGMDEKTAERIFEPFFTTKQPGQGTGMGLAVAHGIVRGHGGAITVQSAIGQGSIFTVYLPLLAGPVPAIRPVKVTPAMGGSGRVLFVDDEESLVEYGRQMLNHLGYQVTAVSSPLEALAILAKDPGGFDLLITDQTMPKMTGLELTRRVHQVRPDLPVILCTGFSAQLDAEVAREAGVGHLVMKPVSMPRLSQVIGQTLAQAKASPGTPA